MANMEDIIQGLVDTDASIINKIRTLESSKANKDALSNLDLSAYLMKSDISLLTTTKIIIDAIKELQDKVTLVYNTAQGSILDASTLINNSVVLNQSEHSNINNSLSNLESFIDSVQSTLDALIQLNQNKPKLVITLQSISNNVLTYTVSPTPTYVTTHYAYLDEVKTQIVPTKSGDTFSYTVPSTSSLVVISVFDGANEYLSGCMANI